MFELTTQSITSLVTLTAMETVLGIDNIIFIAILVSRLPADKQNKIRNLGIGLALGNGGRHFNGGLLVGDGGFKR